MSAGDPCGCPPTVAAADAAAIGVHHVIVNVRDLARSREFYGDLMPRLGYPGLTIHDDGAGYYGPAGSFWLKRIDPRFEADTFHKDRVGLCEIAFGAGSRAQVDALHAHLVARGARVLEAPREYDYTPGYYAVFFADPDGMKLEIVYVPPLAAAGREG